MEEKVAAGPESAPGFGKRIKGFLLPDRLRPPGWSEFGPRWMALFILSAGWLAAALLTGLLLSSGVEKLFVQAALAFVFLLVGGFFYGWRRLGSALKCADFKAAGYHAVLVIAVLVAVGTLIEGRSPGAGKEGADTWLLVGRLLAVGLIGPAAEEFALRLVAFGALRTKLKFAPAALVSSLAFGLLHFGHGDPLKMLAGALAGVLFCWSYERTGSFLTPLGIHLIYNLATLPAPG